MKILPFATFLVATVLGNAADGRSYSPLGEADTGAAPSPPSTRALDPADRPTLPGLRPAEVELLEDALRRKRPIKVGSSRERAYETIIRNGLRDPVKRSHMKGMLAEALFLENNPEWGYVRSSNAPQVDLYRWMPGQRRPLGAQVKTHATSDPAIYARDMVQDHRADRFLVPDDHVQPLRDYWRKQIGEHRANGATSERIEAERQFARVGRLGFSAKNLDDHFSSVVRHCLRERNARYVSIGAGLALIVGPDLWTWWRTGSMPDQFAYRALRGGSILAAERAAQWTLARASTGALRGSLRGNVVSGLVIVAVDTGFSIHESGGTAAFRSESFYTTLGGGIAATTLGFSVGTLVGVAVTGAAAAFGPWAPVIGSSAGFAAGFAGGTAGYFGGHVVTRTILEVIDPAFLHDAERAAIQSARERVNAEITRLQTEAVPGNLSARTKG